MSGREDGLVADHDDDPVEPEVSDEVVERILAGRQPGPDDPPWAADLALLVAAAEAPPTPDELSDEAALVRAMAVVRRTALGGHDVEPADPTVLDPLPPGRTATETVAAAAPAGAGTAPGAEVVDLRDRAPRHLRPPGATERAVARLAASSHPAARTLGRVLAVKAAAAATAVGLGVAAAAATTGIVAKVVVPAIEEIRTDEPTTTTVQRPAEPTTTTAGPDARAGTPADRPTTTACDPGTAPAAEACEPAPATTTTTTAGGVAPPEPPATTVPDPGEPAPVATTEAPTPTTSPTTEPPPTTAPPSTSTTTTTAEPPPPAGAPDAGATASGTAS
ncbi:MAG TPA: hypothetical protein VKZ72_09600 [Acidimicrobiales bacterium]|nr:hypothetical protein [Acidimicrobiales bacterium]